VDGEEPFEDQGLVPERAEPVQLLRRDHDVAVRSIRVAGDDGSGVDRAVAGAALVVADALAAVGVELIEVRGGVRANGGVGLDGKRGRVPDRKQLLNDLLSLMACHAAVRAGDRLTPEEIAALLAQRELAQDSHHCPHGRPTSLRFSRHDLERQFRRV